MAQSVLTGRRKDNTNWESEVNSPKSVTQQFSSLTVEKVKPGLHIVITEGEDGWLVARCLELSAAISQGRTKEEAIRNINEAISLVLEDMDELFVSSTSRSKWSYV